MDYFCTESRKTTEAFIGIFGCQNYETNRFSFQAQHNNKLSQFSCCSDVTANRIDVESKGTLKRKAAWPETKSFRKNCSRQLSNGNLWANIDELKSLDEQFKTEDCESYHDLLVKRKKYEECAREHQLHSDEDMLLDKFESTESRPIISSCEKCQAGQGGHISHILNRKMGSFS